MLYPELMNICKDIVLIYLHANPAAPEEGGGGGLCAFRLLFASAVQEGKKLSRLGDELGRVAIGVVGFVSIYGDGSDIFFVIFKLN